MNSPVFLEKPFFYLKGVYCILLYRELFGCFALEERRVDVGLWCSTVPETRRAQEGRICNDLNVLLYIADDLTKRFMQASAGGKLCLTPFLNFFPTFQLHSKHHEKKSLKQASVSVYVGAKLIAILVGR